MYNVFQYNTQPYNTIIGVSLNNIVDADISYGDFVLHKTDNVYVRNVNTPDSPNSRITRFDIPNSHGSVLLQRRFNNRTVVIE